jgi:protoheme IX farnesyltransferase
MKTAIATLLPEAPALARARALDYLQLTKPRIAVLVLFTVCAGALLADRSAVGLLPLLHTLLGTALVAAGASAMNQFLERHHDARMRRTENRPLPAGRLQPAEAFILAAALGICGVLYLAFTLRQPWAALIAGFTYVSYAFVYTPLKRLTTWNTLCGAVPGALPPIIGWAGVRGSLDAEAASLFLIIFLWQLPHFFAIAWIYRAEYAGAGFRMLPIDDRTGRRTAANMICYCLALLAAGVAPAVVGRAGPLFVAGALILGLFFFATTIGFARNPSEARARRVLRASLVYLPAVLALLLVDGWFGAVAGWTTILF